MILTVHIADVGLPAALRALRWRPEAGAVSGLRYAVMTTAAPLRTGRAIVPQPGRVGLIAAWNDDVAFDRFRGENPLARMLASGWHVRLAPLRSWGAWSGLPGLPEQEQELHRGPVAVLTLGRPRLRRLRSFLATSAVAEREAMTHPALLAATALARPPRLVATFSLWRTVPEMREYAVGSTPGGHLHAIQAHTRDPFHHESVFVRFRPYGAQGRWDGFDPLTAASNLDASRP